METIQWPDKFPDMDKMILILKKTIQTSWKNNLTIDDVQKWLDNFEGKVYIKEEEQRLALWMLCNYTYYNESEINHLCKTIYKQLFHDIVSSNNLVGEVQREKMFSNIYFAAMGNASESGGLLLYHFRQESEMSLDRFVYPTAIPLSEENIAVFIDDVTLSGDTATTFFKNNIDKMKFKCIYYITLFASKEAVVKLESQGVKVLSCTLLDERDKCFSDNSIMFLNYPTLRDYAMNMALHYGRLIEEDCPMGHKEGAFYFGFYYNTPNNTLPIFWSCNNWYPIFPRKEKIKDVTKRKAKFERYI